MQNGSLLDAHHHLPSNIFFGGFERSDRTLEVFGAQSEALGLGLMTTLAFTIAAVLQANGFAGLASVFIEGVSSEFRESSAEFVAVFRSDGLRLFLQGQVFLLLELGHKGGIVAPRLADLLVGTRTVS